MDYTDFKSGEPSKTAQSEIPTGGTIGYWWCEKDEESIAKRMIQAANELRQDQADETQANLRHARLYGNFDALGFNIRDYNRSASAPYNKIALNVIASCVDTLAAKIAKNSPRPAFVTDGGNAAEQRRARRLDKFVQGLFYETRIYEQMVRVFIDSCIFGTGCLKIYYDSQCKKICCERVLPAELMVDDADAIHGEPRQLFQKRLVAREVLLNDPDFTDTAEKKLAIEQAKNPVEGGQGRGFGDVVEVWEAWHLPSGPNAKDGCHVIAIEGCGLFSEPWKRARFPFVFLHYTPKVLGFWGQGLAERLSGIQLEINRLLRSIGEQLRRKGRGRVFYQKGTVNPNHFTNNVADVIPVSGSPTASVHVDSGSAVAGEEFAQLDRLRSAAYQEAGISELSAGAKKPSGLDSQPALREFSDFETERFALQGKRYERAHLDATEIMFDTIIDAGVDYETKYLSKHSMEVVSSKDLDLSRSGYVMKMFPVSSLPQTPSARLQRVRELKADGFIPDQATAQRLLDFPDLEAEGNLAYAAVDDVDATIAAILDADEPEFMQPEEYQNLPLLMQRAQAAYLRARHSNVEQKRLDLLRRLIDATSELLLSQQSAAAPEPMSPPGPPAMPAGGPQMPMNMNINPSANVQVPVPPLAPPIAAS